MRILGLVLASLPLVACAPGAATTAPDSSATDALTSSTAVYDSYEEVMQLALDAGLECNHAVIVATAIAFAESSGNIHARNHNPNGTWDYGLWQINSVHGMTRSYLFDASNNADAMVEISSAGTNFHPWSTYGSGAYKKHMSGAQAAYANVCGS